MTTSTVEEKMINQAFGNLENNNHDLALLSIVPLFDKACKKTWPRLGVGARFRKGIEETEDIISFVMLGGRGTITASTYGKWTLPELMYKYLRNSIVHEGQMPDQVKIIDEPKIVKVVSKKPASESLFHRIWTRNIP